MSEEETKAGETPETGAAAETAVAAPVEAPAAAPRARSAKSEGVAEARGTRKTRIGVVVSDKMQKTIVVSVVRRVPHPRFKKIVKQTTKLYAHDEKEEAKVGDRVRVMETRPLSKKKCWRLLEVLAH